ncbi:MAG: hypothetical protein KF727_02135 [Microbacteriaceae bacterium]|nr:hypothetical protein [Microbacteriaceae bacterium]
MSSVARSSVRLLAMLLALVCALAVQALVSAPARAATRDVCAVGCTYSTVQAAVTAAAANDTITIAAGTYNVMGVVINKPLTIVGAGKGVTILDGGGATGSANPGIFRILPGVVGNGVGSIIITNMTLQNPGATSTTYFDISIGVKQVTTGIDLIELGGLEVIGTGNIAKPGYGVYADGGYSGGNDRDAPDLWIHDSSFTDHVYNAIGVDAYRGDVTIEDNDLREGLGGSSALLVFNEYTPNQIENPVIIRNNTSVGRLVWVQNLNMFSTLGGFKEITIQGNTVTGFGANDFLAFVASNSSDGAAATRIGKVTITGNTMIGDQSAANVTAVTIGGAVDEAIIEDNQFIGLTSGVVVQQVKSQNPVSVTINRNSLFANVTGVSNSTTATVDASGNWWGCQLDPAVAATGCSTASNTGAGAITTGPWVVTTASLSAPQVGEGGTLTVNASLDTLSDGTASNLPASFVGLPVVWSATRGSITPAPGALGGALATSGTYHAPSTAGSDTITVQIDLRALTGGNQLGDPVTLALRVLPALAATGSDGSTAIAAGLAGGSLVALGAFFLLLTRRRRVRA